MGARGLADQRGAQDWAGGMVVHASAGAAALALLVVLGRRRVWPDRAPLPHSIPLVIVGAGILWFGWFGFNAGDGLQANGVAAQALINTQVAAAAAMLVWLVVERVRDGHATVLGGVTGAVGGLATITPAAGYVSTTSAIIIGALAGLVCHVALRLKVVFKYDDALDVIAVHFVGGMLGSLLVGFFGEEAINSIGADGVFFGGGFGLLGEQVLALAVVIAFSFAGTWLIAMGIEHTIGLRVAPEDEEHLDEIQQGMGAYDHSPFASSGVTAATQTPPPARASSGTGRVWSRRSWTPRRWTAPFSPTHSFERAPTRSSAPTHISTAHRRRRSWCEANGDNLKARHEPGSRSLPPRTRSEGWSRPCVSMPEPTSRYSYRRPIMRRDEDLPSMAGGERASLLVPRERVSARTPLTFSTTNRARSDGPAANH